MKADLIAARGRVSKLSCFVHDLMDACQLERIGSTRVPSWQSLSMGQSRCAYTMPSATPSFSVPSNSEARAAINSGTRFLDRSRQDSRPEHLASPCQCLW